MKRKHIVTNIWCSLVYESDASDSFLSYHSKGDIILREKEGMRMPMRKNTHEGFHVKRSLKWYDLIGDRNA